MNTNLEESEISVLTALYKFYKENRTRPVLTLHVENEIGEPVGSLNPTFKSLQDKELISFHNEFGIFITEKGIQVIDEFQKNELNKYSSK